MNRQHIGLLEFFLCCLVMLALILAASAWAWSAWLEHYA